MSMKRSVTWEAPSAKRSRPYQKSKQYMKRPTTSSSLRQYVKAAVNRLAERKAFIAQGNNISIPVVTGSVPLGLQLAPAVTQGTSQNQRVGNQIKVVRATVRGHIAIRPYDSIGNPGGPPAMIKLWLVKYSPSNPASLSGTDISTAFFDTGSTVTGLQGNIYDLDAYLNKDSWRLLDEKILKVGSASASANMPSASAYIYDNSSMILPFKFEYGKHIGKCLYNDSVSLPTNTNVFLVFQCVYASGTTSTGSVPAEVSYHTKVEYTDL